LEAALKIASTPNWYEELSWIHYSLAQLFLDEDGFDDANAHIELAKSHAANDAHILGRVMERQAKVWYRQRRLEDAKSETLHALEIYEKLGAVYDAGFCRNFLQKVKREMKT